MKMMVSAPSENDGRSFVPVSIESLLGQAPAVPGQYVQRSQLPSGFSESFDPNWVAPEYVPSPVIVDAPAASPMKAVVPVITADDFRRRQRYAESGFNDKAVSKAGAKGAYQIMPSVLNDYVAATGKKGDLFDYEYNQAVRDWYVDWLMNRPVVNGNGNTQSDVNTWAKMAAAYNWGVGNLTKYLQKLKDKGEDIYNSTDWIEGLNPETRDYVKFIALQQDTTGPRTTEAFNKAMAKYNLASDGGRIRTIADRLMEKGYYSDGGKIYIKPSKRGTFKAQATKMGMGVKEAAHHILAHKDNYSPAMVKKANFAANFADYGGTLLRPYNEFATGGQVPPENDGDKYDIWGNELEPGGVAAPENMSDVSDAIGFVQNYYTSPGYLRRLGDAGLPQEELLIAPYVKYDYSTPIYGSESNMGLGTMTIGVQPHKYVFPLYTNQLTGAIARNRGIDELNDSASGAFPAIVAAHESAHFNPLYNTSRSKERTKGNPNYRYDYSSVPAWYKYLLTPNNPANNHDAELSENYSDLMALRYFLQKNGIFDSTDKNTEFTDDDYQKMMSTDGAEKMRFLKYHNKDKVIKAINDIASLGSGPNLNLGFHLSSFGGLLK